MAAHLPHRRGVRGNASAGCLCRDDDWPRPGGGAYSGNDLLFSTQPSCITHPICVCIIGIFGGGAAAAFVLLHGAGNGLLTIARGTLPLSIFGPENYGYRLGLLGASSRVCQALAPLGFSLLIDVLGGAS